MARETSPGTLAGRPLLRPTGLTRIGSADLLVRSAYQMGKSPLLPLFAASLGATETYLGLIVSVSTLTGMFLKPLVGILSDRWGRRGWLLLGTAFFAGVPFLYHWVTTPGQLLGLRLIHGLGTAIYGPVTLAYVAERSPTGVAERIGWFSLARSGGQIIGPAAAGWLLLTLDPVTVFSLIGLLSALAFIPLWRLPPTARSSSQSRPTLARQIRETLSTAARASQLWLAGGLEAASNILLYAVKAFLPLYGLAAGINVAVVGGLLAGQELTGMVLKPWGGRLADRWGPLPTILSGMALLGVGIGLLSLTPAPVGLLVSGVLLGTGQAFIFPASVAWLATGTKGSQLVIHGGALGLLGTLRNGGKIAGPILAGWLISRFAYQGTYLTLSLVCLSGVLLLMLSQVYNSRALFKDWRPRKERKPTKFD